MTFIVIVLPALRSRMTPIPSSIAAPFTMDPQGACTFTIRCVLCGCVLCTCVPLYVCMCEVRG